MSDLRLMIPGPVDVDEDVLAALSEPTLPHYGAEWMPTLDATIEYLKRLFETQGDVLIVPGPGSGGLEAAISSLVPTGEGIFIPSSGFFGMRLGQIAEACGLHPWKTDFTPGTHIDPAEVRQQLEKLIPQAEAEGHPIHALAVVHHETSTGVLNPLREIAQVAREFGLPVIVDAVASFGGVRLPVEEWGIDVCVSVANKCLAVPPGVALIAVSQRAWDIAHANPSRHGWYYDLRTWAWYIENWGDWHPSPVTMPTNNIVALLKALRNIFENGGMKAHFASIENAAKQVRAEMSELGFTLFPEPSYAAPIVSALNTRPDVDISEMLGYLLNERRVMVSGGIADLRGKIFRVGHMGRAREPEYIDALVEATRDFLHSKSLI